MRRDAFLLAEPGHASHTPLTKRWQSTSLILLASAVLTVLGLWFAVQTLTAGLCANTVIRAVDAPDAARTAILFARNCGATAKTSTHVSVVNTGASLGNEPGNAFIAELGDSGSPASWGGPWVALEWRDASTLTVRHDRLARVAKAEQRVAGARIRFAPVAWNPGNASGDDGAPADVAP